MIQYFYILGSNQERPISDRTIFADGSSDTSFLVGIDLELSHWSGSKTPSEYKADTSTEICMKFIKSYKDKLATYDLAMNNHLDFDGILSVFTLIHSEIALKYSTTIIEAATIGDFWGFGSDEAFILFQGLKLFYNDLVNMKEDIRKIYSLSFEEVKKLLTSLKGTFEGIHQGVSVIKRSLKMIENNEIKRIQYHERFVLYIVPKDIARNNLERCIYHPDFNEVISVKGLLFPHARNKFDRERIHLVSVETSKGWYYTLHYPGYSWADTPDSWRPPEAIYSDAFFYAYKNQKLDEVVEKLNKYENGDGSWSHTIKFGYDETFKKGIFPIILSFMTKDYKVARSTINTEKVAELLSEVYS